MKLLLDKHFIVWLTDEPKRLTPRETSIIFDDGNELAISAASIWEIRLKWRSVHGSGESKLDLPPDAALNLAEFLGMVLLPVTMEHAAAWLEVPLLHKDPFDEMLLIQAQVEGLRLLTRDKLLRGHPLVLYA